jgi:hypothetical protein
MPRLEGKQAKQGASDPKMKGFFSNTLGSCGVVQTISYRPFPDSEARDLGIELPPIGRGTNASAPSVMLPRLFYENLLNKYQKLPGQKGMHISTEWK